MPRLRKGPGPDEIALWQRVAETARPLHPRARPKPVEAEPATASPRPSPPSPFRLGEAAPPRAPSHAIQPGLSERLAGEPVRMDRKAYTRMARGKLAPEAKLDLHGLTLADAHPALNRFVLSAAGRGLRLVLVVTGKGAEADERGWPEPGRGVLRHQVPHWLAQPPLAAHVLQVAEAHRRHGGAGAFYVYLRRHPGKVRD